jgi:hypothetical protein
MSLFLSTTLKADVTYRELFSIQRFWVRGSRLSQKADFAFPKFLVVNAAFQLLVDVGRAGPQKSIFDGFL